MPSGKTLKGDWGTYFLAGEVLNSTDSILFTTVSFGIPLAAPPVPHQIPAPTEAEEEEGKFPKPPTGCTGNVSDPGAEPGNLCVFVREEANIQSSVGIKRKICPTAAAGLHESPGDCLVLGLQMPEAADRFGFSFLAFAEKAGSARIAGTWAVTAE
jgi:hypothetical protein